jgi:uncharacterized membrane protein YedE/YeeE
MDSSLVIQPLIGGLLIGIAVSLMLLFNGRVTGISGILASALARPTLENLWRWFFILGLIIGGAIMRFIRPEYFVNSTSRSILAIGIAGLLVGFGTVMGSGCTSGHGVCGVSRFSVRSVVATFTFMLFGFLTVTVIQHFFGGAL